MSSGLGRVKRGGTCSDGATFTPSILIETPARMYRTLSLNGPTVLFAWAYLKLPGLGAS